MKLIFGKETIRCDYGDSQEEFIIQDINIPISVNAIIDINCTNIALLPYYPSS